VSAAPPPRPDPPPPLRYEKRDVEARAVLRFSVMLGVFAVITTLVLLPVFGWLRSRELGQDPPAPAMGRQAPGARQAPEPRLQVSPPQDLQAVQRDAERRLHSYGWVDEDKRIVHIPIEDAMRLLAQRSAAPSPPAAPSAPAGPQGSGRAPEPSPRPEGKP
jgi:hypothetical protein